MSILQQRASDVRVQEINLSQVITSRSSAVGALLVVSKQGSTEMKRFTSGDSFLAEYGNPDAQISFDGYTGIDFFREANDIWSRRVVGAGAKVSAVLLYLDGGVTKLVAITAGVDDPTLPEWDELLPPGATEAIALFYPNRGPGSYGDNVAIAITSNNVEAPAVFTANSASTGGILPAANYEYQIASIGTNGETLVGAPVGVVIAGSGVTNSVELAWESVPLAIGYRIYGRTNDQQTFGLLAEVGQASNTFRDTGGVVPDAAQKPITDPADLPAPVATFGVEVYDLTQSRTYTAEGFNCTLQPFTDGDGADAELEARINPFSSYIQVTSNVPNMIATPAVTASARTAMAGGNSGSAPTSFQIAAAWASFSNKQLYPINLLMNSGRGDPNIQRTMNTLAETRGDSVALLDIPSAQQRFQQAIDYRNLQLRLNSTYAAIFAGDVLEADNINGKQQYVPFSGWAGALCARTDRVANPSFSIAGLNRGIVDVLKTRHTYDDGQASAMFRAQVNYLRSFSGIGDALWEQKTMATQDSALSWLSVRRIVNVMKVSIYDFLLYSLQEPNDEFSARQIVSSCSEYLEQIKNARAISRYTVVSDSSNNTVAMVNSAIRKVTVVIVPILPIHEIQLDMVISKEGVAFAETLNSLS